MPMPIRLRMPMPMPPLMTMPMPKPMPALAPIVMHTCMHAYVFTHTYVYNMKKLPNAYAGLSIA